MTDLIDADADEDEFEEKEIPIHKIKHNILEKAIDFCTLHKKKLMAEED